MSTDDFQASFHTKWRLLFIQHNDPGRDKQLDLKSNKLNIRPLGFPKSTHGKKKVNSDGKGVLKGQKFEGEYETELELRTPLKNNLRGVSSGGRGIFSGQYRIFWNKNILENKKVLNIPLLSTKQ